jgi:hypothetical protein
MTLSLKVILRSTMVGMVVETTKTRVEREADEGEEVAKEGQCISTAICRV